MVLEKLDSHMYKNEIRTFLTPYTEWIKDLIVRQETIKLLEENIVRTLYDVSHRKISMTHLLV